MKKYHILIVTDSFLPCFAPRMGYLAKELIDRGNKVSVVATCYWDCKPLYGISGVHADISHISSKGIIMLKSRFFSRLFKRLFYFEGEFTELCRKMYDKAKLLYSESPVDLIVASSAYTPAFAKIAFNLSCEFNVPWVADFRDIHEQYPPLNLFKIKNIYNTAWNKIQIKRRNLIIKKASLCTVVSKLHNAILSKNHPNVKTIYNGYDDSVFFPRSEKKNGIFTICYGGRVYADNQFQNADMFFQALKLLHDKKTIDHECFQCAFYVDENSASLVKELSAKYGVFQYVKLHEQVSNQNFSRIASQCEILLVLNSPQASGVIGTKFYEYLGLRRPILVVESDLGEMSDILQSSKSGCAARDSDEAHSYINDKYQQWREFGFVANLDWDEKIQFYTRKNQSDIFAKELLHLVDK